MMLAMLDADSAVLLPLWVGVGLLFILLCLMIRALMLLGRLAPRVESKKRRKRAEPEAEVLEETQSQEQTSAFEQFLSEDPMRNGMPKTEQFAAYREWRKKKGMNWSS